MRYGTIFRGGGSFERSSKPSGGEFCSQDSSRWLAVESDPRTADIHAKIAVGRLTVMSRYQHWQQAPRNLRTTRCGWGSAKCEGEDLTGRPVLDHPATISSLCGACRSVLLTRLAQPADYPRASTGRGGVNGEDRQGRAAAHVVR